MHTFFAYAEPTDLSGSSWLLMMICGAILVGALGLVLVPITLAYYGRLRKTDAITAGAVVWGLAVAWNAMTFAIAEFSWKREWLLRVQTGYFDPRDTKGAPVWSWPIWGSLMVVYALLVGLSIAGRNPQED
jgi:hypothetical protein